MTLSDEAALRSSSRCSPLFASRRARRLGALLCIAFMIAYRAIPFTINDRPLCRRSIRSRVAGSLTFRSAQLAAFGAAPRQAPLRDLLLSMGDSIVTLWCDAMLPPSAAEACVERVSGGAAAIASRSGLNTSGAGRSRRWRADIPATASRRPAPGFVRSARRPTTANGLAHHPDPSFGPRPKARSSAMEPRGAVRAVGPVIEYRQ